MVSSVFESRKLGFISAIGSVALWITIRMMLGRDVFRHEVFRFYSLIDPFGTIASAEFSLSQTVAQSNMHFPPLEGLFLWNRLIWIICSVSMAALGVCMVPMRLRLVKEKKFKKEQNWKIVNTQSAPPSFTPTKNFIYQFISMVRWELILSWRHPAAKLCVALIGLTIWWSAESSVTHLFSLPSTDLLIHNTNFYFVLFSFFY